MGTRDEVERKKRIAAMATEIVLGMVDAGEINPEDEKALRKATREAVQTAKAAYDAANEYIS